MLDEGCSTTRNGREKRACRLFIGGIRARSEARRMRGECRPSLKAGQRDMSQCVLTSPVGRRWWDSRWSDRPAEGWYRTREGGTDARVPTSCIYAAMTAPSVENSRELRVRSRIRRIPLIDSPPWLSLPFAPRSLMRFLFEIKVKK